MSIAPIGCWDGRTRSGLSELLPEGPFRLLSRAGQSKVNAALAERRKKAYESAPTSAYIEM
jgi:hypothetical protein